MKGLHDFCVTLDFRISSLNTLNRVYAMTEQTTWREATRASHHPNKHITHSKLTCQLFCSKRERESSVEWTEGDDRLGTQIEINTEMPFYDKVQTQREMKTISRDKHNKAEVIRFRSKRTVLWMKQTNCTSNRCLLCHTYFCLVYFSVFYDRTFCIMHAIITLIKTYHISR